MNPDAAVADRRQSVRDACREWLRAKWIDEAACQHMEKLYPDDRVRVGPAFRVLFLILTFVAVMAVLGAMYSLTDAASSGAMLAIFAGLSCWLIANYLSGSKRRRQGGIESAFSLAAVLNLTIGAGIFLYDHRWMNEASMLILILFLIAGLCLAAAWVWGYWIYAAISAATVFLAILSIPDGRYLYIVAVGALYPWLLKSSDSAQLPPSLRKCAAAYLVVALLGLYAAVNVCLLDQHSFLDLFSSLKHSESFPRWLSIVLTAIFPVLIWLTGVLQRRRLFMLLGFGLTVLSLVTLRMYVHVAPPWLIFTGSGILLLAATGMLRRFLDSGAEGERAGFTAAPLTEPLGKHRAAEILAGVATMTPSAASTAEGDQFHGEGGKFGGGGASGHF
jgi:hypothetical protein